MTQKDRDGLTTRQLGAIVVLNAEPAIQVDLARHMGVELQPGEDLLTGFARHHGMSRCDVQTYFEAIAQGIDFPEARRIAAPAAGAVQ